MAQHVLKVEVRKQLMTNWCWAAVTIAIAEHYKDSGCGSQCQWVSRINFGLDCCSGCSDNVCSNEACNTDHLIGDSLAEAKHISGSATDPLGPTMDLVIQEIDVEQPLVGIVDWNEGGSHAVVIYGYTDDGLVFVADPEKPGTVQTMASDFLYNPGAHDDAGAMSPLSGRCSGVFLTIP